MTWVNEFPQADEPALEQITRYIDSPLWQELCDFVETHYKSTPQVEYSKCSGAPGWNVKYKKSGRSLCTLYPHKGYYTSLVCMGSKDLMEAELEMSACSDYTRDMYMRAKPVNGTRWLMIDVTSGEILEDVKRLICVRAGQSNKRIGS